MRSTNIVSGCFCGGEIEGGVFHHLGRLSDRIAAEDAARRQKEAQVGNPPFPSAVTASQTAESATKVPPAKGTPTH